MKSFEKSLEHLEGSLNHKHPSMSLERNPVLAGVQDNASSTSELRYVLAQYSLLPAEIVTLLSIGRKRLEEWTEVKEELDRNIGEEMGSRTKNLSHYAILRDALVEELSLDVSAAAPSPGTARFLDAVRTGLTNDDEPFVAGVLYALEASAVPELTIVAKLINKYAASIGSKPAISMESLTERPEKTESASDKYTLDAFFAAHLWDFEVGHRAGLETSLAKHLSTDDLKDFEAGFEYVLDAMDEWWGSLAFAAEPPFDGKSFAASEEEQNGYVPTNNQLDELASCSA
jgi:hypothetical protein